MAVLGLCFCARAFSSCGERGPLFIAVRGPLTIATSLVAEHRLQTRRLSSCGSRKATFFTHSVIQMLISSGNTLTDTPRNNVLLASLSPVKLTHKINHHTHVILTIIFYYPLIINTNKEIEAGRS